MSDSTRAGAMHRRNQMPENSRYNGWQLPFHSLQMASWFFVALFIATSWPLYFAFFDAATSATLTVVRARAARHMR